MKSRKRKTRLLKKLSKAASTARTRVSKRRSSQKTPALSWSEERHRELQKQYLTEEILKQEAKAPDLRGLLAQLEYKDRILDDWLIPRDYLWRSPARITPMPERIRVEVISYDGKQREAVFFKDNLWSVTGLPGLLPNNNIVLWRYI